MDIFKQAYDAATEKEFVKGDMYYTFSGVFKIIKTSPPGQDKVEVIQSIGKNTSVQKCIPKILLMY